MRKLFGTDGVRGIANVEPMTGEMAMKLGRAAAHIFKNKAGRHRIVIGKDTRISGYMLESALTSGICSMGVDVLLLGPLPTPAVAFLARSLRVDAGVMISASHNPYEDNGIKFFSKEGLKLPDEMEQQIESMIFSGEIDTIRPTAGEIGKAFRIDDAEGRYIEFAKNSLPKGLDFQGIKIVVDCAQGAAYKVTPMVLKELGADVIVISDTPSGTNINHNCGALHPEDLQKKVLEHQADIGIAHDGDADRAVFVDEKGKVVDGDAILVAFALALHQEKMLKGETLVTTLMSNMGVEIALRSEGIRVVRTPVGDRYVLERMIKEGYNLGGEQSGHFIFLDYNTTGDGLITALQLLSLMKRTGKTVSKVAACMTSLPQVLTNVKVQRKQELSEIPEMQKAISDCEEKLKNHGRILVRYSGTEPLLRIMIEGENQEMISKMAEELAGIVQSKIGIPK
jgi:phosphoglucosamine mutase